LKENIFTQSKAANLLFFFFWGNQVIGERTHVNSNTTYKPLFFLKYIQERIEKKVCFGYNFNKNLHLLNMKKLACDLLGIVILIGLFKEVVLDVFCVLARLSKIFLK